MIPSLAPVGQRVERAAVGYDLAVGPIADALKDTIVQHGLALLGEHLACGPTIAVEAPEAVLDGLRGLEVPPSRQHVHRHLWQSAEGLCRLGAAERPSLTALAEAWRHLATAMDEGGHKLIDLSQCCGGHKGALAKGSLHDGL